MKTDKLFYYSCSTKWCRLYREDFSTVATPKIVRSAIRCSYCGHSLRCTHVEPLPLYREGVRS